MGDTAFSGQEAKEEEKGKVMRTCEVAHRETKTNRVCTSVLNDELASQPSFTQLSLFPTVSLDARHASCCVRVRVCVHVCTYSSMQVAVAQRGEASAKKEASALRNMVQQLQAVVAGEVGGGGGNALPGAVHSPGGGPAPSSSSLALVSPPHVYTHVCEVRGRLSEKRKWRQFHLDSWSDDLK